MVTVLKNEKNKLNKDNTNGDIYIPNYECDLHCHTNRSNGNDTPLELIIKAGNLGMKAVAITDHDIVPPLIIEDDNNRKVSSVIFAKQNNVDLILGYEFSCDTDVDDVHILGYRCDWTNKNIVDELKKAKKSKSDAYRQLCKILSSSGFELDYDSEILHYKGADNNICTREPEEVEKKLIFEEMAKKGFAPSWQEAKLMVRKVSKIQG